MKKWSVKYDKCISCGTIAEIHVAKGLCKQCYNKSIDDKHKDYKRNKRGVAETFLTKEKLLELYIEKEMSLSDIGKSAGTTRENVYYKIKRFNIPLRNKSSARTLALDKGKIKHTFKNSDNIEEEKTLNKIRFNEDFFEDWSNEMAYVLGLIYTDGCLDPGKRIDPTRKTTLKVGRLQFAQKEVELVEKFLNLMECDARISFAKKRVLKETTAGEMHYVQINSDRLYYQLIRLGLTPKKSLIVGFPKIPEQYVRHFIRGCWDGDGTIFLSKAGVSVGFVSGSLSFIKSLMTVLENAGLSRRKLYTNANGSSYYFRYSRREDVLNLYNFMYYEVPESHLLLRKFQIFNTFLNQEPTQFQYNDVNEGGNINGDSLDLISP
jgi:predicted DNA-binding protein YlxM (UPF0122 family)